MKNNLYSKKLFANDQENSHCHSHHGQMRIVNNKNKNKN